MYKIDVDFKLPIAWEIVTLSDVCDIDPSVDFKVLDDETEISFVPMALVEELTGKLKSDNFERVGKLKKGYSRFKNGDVLFAKITPCMENGKIAVAENLPFEVGAGSTEFFVLRSSFGICNKFVLYYLLQKAYRLDAQHHMSGAVGQKRVPKTYISNSRIPLPPLAEQKRIVDKIETLFSDLDKGEALLRQVQQLLAVYRQSVLKAAVTGEMTSEWREQNKHRLESGEVLLQRILKLRRENWNGRGKCQEPACLDTKMLSELPDSWIWLSIDMLGDVTTGSTPPTDKSDLYYGGDIPFIKPTDLDQGETVRSSRDSITQDGLEKTRFVRNPSVLVTCIGATIGKTGYVDFPVAAFNQQINAIEPKYEIFDANLLYWFVVESSFQHRIIGNASATTLPIINKTKFSQLPIACPPIEEQSIILEKIISINSQINALEKWCATELARSGMLRQSILKAAFSGELVPQDPEDEPASELLARIQAERASAALDGNGRRVATKRGRKAIG